MRPRFDPWVGKILWRRKWQPTLVFLPGQSYGQRSLSGYSTWGLKRVRHDLATKQQYYLILNKYSNFSTVPQNSFMVIVLSRASILESRIKHFILLLDLVSLFILEQSPSFCDNDPLKRLGQLFCRILHMLVSSNCTLMVFLTCSSRFCFFFNLAITLKGLIRFLFFFFWLHCAALWDLINSTPTRDWTTGPPGNSLKGLIRFWLHGLGKNTSWMTPGISFLRCYNKLLQTWWFKKKRYVVLHNSGSQKFKTKKSRCPQGLAHSRDMREKSVPPASGGCWHNLTCGHCGVSSQGHKREVLHQGHGSRAQNQGHLWNWLSPFVTVVKSLLIIIIKLPDPS